MTALNITHPAWKGKLDEEFLLAITCVGKLSDIEELQLCNLNLKNKDIDPEVFNKLTSLVELNLSGNELHSIPEGIFLHKLQYLDMSRNRMENVEWFSRFSNLVDVDFEDNVGLTIDDRYKIMFLLEKLHFLDGKRVDERDRIGEKFTMELLSRMERLWNDQFKVLLKKPDTEEKVNRILDKFIETSKEKIRYGPNSLKGYRLWRIESIARDVVKLKMESPDGNLMQIFSDEDDGGDAFRHTNSPAKYQKRKSTSKEEQLKKRKKSLEVLTSHKQISDYEPFAFLQCHSMNEGPDDFSTQVWCCAFEHDINDSSKTTNIVATCGGDTVCLVDCSTAKVQARFQQINEEFYTVAWTTIELNNRRTNILVAAGCLGFVHLIHVSQGICYGRIKAHSSPVQTIKFAPGSSTHLLTADKKGNIYLIDIDIPTVPEYKFSWKKLVSFNGLDCTPLKLQVASNFLLSATEYGLFCWKAENIFDKPRKSSKEALKKVPVLCEITFPYVDDQPMVDALEKLNDDVMVAKCAQQGVIFLWRFSQIKDKITHMGKTCKKLEAGILAELKWSSTNQCYINISTCAKHNMVVAGDDQGNIWMYDTSKVVKSKKFAKASDVVDSESGMQPNSIIPFPQCVKPNGATIHKLRNKTIYNDICCSHDMKCIVVAADSNIVAIFRKKDVYNH